MDEQEDVEVQEDEHVDPDIVAQVRAEIQAQLGEESNVWKRLDKTIDQKITDLLEKSSESVVQRIINWLTENPEQEQGTLELASPQSQSEGAADGKAQRLTPSQVRSFPLKPSQVRSQREWEEWLEGKREWKDVAVVRRTVEPERPTESG